MADNQRYFDDKFAEAKAALDSGDPGKAGQIIAHAAVEAGGSGDEGFNQALADLVEAGRRYQQQRGS